MDINASFEKGARPIKSSVIQSHYQSHDFSTVPLNQYLAQWQQWLISSSTKSLLGLDSFCYGDYTQGTSQTFDHFILRHCASRDIVFLRGEFQYHACISKRVKSVVIDSPDQLRDNHALIISAPFSDLGILHPDFYNLLERCNTLGVPVCLDLAYWGIARNISIDLSLYQSVREVTSSLSKPFFTLENHRVGVRLSRDYLDDGISMLNEVNMQNFYSMSLGIHYMKSFSNDWNWLVHGSTYDQVCMKHNLIPTDTVIFGRSTSDRYQEFSRGIAGNYRICVSKMLVVES